MTKVIIDAAKALDITAYDHISSSKDSHVSLKGLKLI